MEDHKRNCKICNSDDRNDIEKEYMAWTPIVQIVSNHPAINDGNIQRHVIATGLREKRSKNSDAMINAIIERGMNAVQTINSVALIRAIELKCRKAGELSKDGTPVNLHLTIEQIEKKRSENLKEGLNRFGYAVEKN
jgi:hypothetical protein